MSRGIRHLVHFTQLRNLPSIVTYGLLSRVDLGSLGIRTLASAAYRLDERDEAVSVSISAINWKMFEAKRQDAGRSDWVVLMLDPSILWTHRCRFLSRNAARREMKGHRGRLDGPWAFERMFSDDIPDPRFKGASYRAGTAIPDCLTTRPDAEVQVLDPIAPEAIVEAWAERRAVAEAVQDELNRLPGKERDVTVREFLPRFSNGHDSWG